LSIDVLRFLPRKRRAKVAWNRVLEEIIGKPVRIREVMMIAERHRINLDKQLYYSEVSSWLLRLRSKGYYVRVEKDRETNAVYYTVSMV